MRVHAERIFRIVSKSYDLVLWSSGRDISREEIAENYLALSDVGARRIFSEPVYAFYCDVLRRYPDVELTAEEDLASNPWASPVEFEEDHVVLRILPEHHDDVSAFILRLAAWYRLACYDAQTQTVHLPSGREVPMIDSSWRKWLEEIFEDRNWR